jgi:hypothetical protein
LRNILGVFTLSLAGDLTHTEVLCKTLDFIYHCPNRSANYMRSTSSLHAYYSEGIESAVSILFWAVPIAQQRKALSKGHWLLANNTRGCSSHVPVLGCSGFSARLDSTKMEIHFWDQLNVFVAAHVLNLYVLQRKLSVQLKSCFSSRCETYVIDIPTQARAGYSVCHGAIRICKCKRVPGSLSHWPCKMHALYIH